MNLYSLSNPQIWYKVLLIKSSDLIWAFKGLVFCLSSHWALPQFKSSFCWGCCTSHFASEWGRSLLFHGFSFRFRVCWKQCQESCLGPQLFPSYFTLHFSTTSVCESPLRPAWFPSPRKHACIFKILDSFFLFPFKYYPVSSLPALQSPSFYSPGLLRLCTCQW